MPFPFQIVQTPQQVLIAYEFANATRQVRIGRKPEAPAESWMGWSIGRWEGETLVVDVTDQVDRTWFDRAGNFDLYEYACHEGNYRQMEDALSGSRALENAAAK